MIAAKHSMMGGGGLPFTPIYGVRSDGYSYCALDGFINSSYGAYEADFSITGTYSGDWHAWGSHGTQGSGGFFTLNLQRQSTNGIFAFGVYRGDPYLPVGRYHISVGRSPSDVWGTLNGSTEGFNVFDNPAYNAGRFLVFRASATNSTTRPQANSSPTVLVIHRLKVWYGDEQVADLIPCREKSTGEVCFYNLIDETFVKNIAGAGSALLEVMEN